MQFSTALAFLAASSVVSGLTVTKRDAATVGADIDTIASDVSKVQKDVDSFNGDAFGALTIYLDSMTLDEAIKKGANDSANSAPFTEDESSTIAGKVLDLQPKVDKVLDSLIAKKDKFQTAIFGFPATPIVKMTLQTLRTDTADFGSKASAKLTPDFQEVAPIVLQEIDDKFAQAIAAFS
ncbi:hypothetical protein EJ05DRAFT_500211 [Pseudovirgaria hyperparasitica]|uniref:Hydrophobic surface binding protein n=1 Tax=Pseudovirgaria hyperparasitica TaxID=470096 RepID=A0A6A6W825_9PEZI|nr:uncharacterized protein EJ05DRAFT_500211 [Pseudovirgaria hyperparasitica]KAF2758695.1 hypothetical protein EJ05DRAFT_500211 [Pseudovirgaria hyperparasitica]